MGLDQCIAAHVDSGSPVNKENNICAGGEEGNQTVLSNFTTIVSSTFLVE